MLKNKFKVIALIFTIITLITTLSLATDTATETLDSAVTTTAEESTTPVDETTTTAEDAAAAPSQDIHEDDLYIIDQTVVMDQLVDGNVYIMGNDVTITGQVNGNLYVMANTLKFDNSYIRYSIFALANEIEMNGACNDLYVACNKMNVSYDSYVVRDARIGCTDLTFKGAIGRNANITANNINLGNSDEEEVALIYGDLNYSSTSEITIPDGAVEGTVNYNKVEESSDEVATKSVSDYVFDLIKTIVFTVVIYILAMWIAPKFSDSLSAYASTKAIPAFGIGLLALIVVPIICVLLLLAVITIPVAFMLFVIWALLISISNSIVSIAIAKALKNKFSIDKKLIECLILALVVIVVWGIELIPFVGGIVSFLVLTIGLGIPVMYAFTKNSKKKVEEKAVTENKEN